MVGASDETTGQAVVAFVIIKESYLDGALRRGARAARCAAGSASRSARSRGPATSTSSGELPKTRSGKIMRRLLRDVAEGREVGDTTTLADTAVMSVISAQVK